MSGSRRIFETHGSWRKLHRARLLAVVRAPTPAEEAVRHLCRARDDARAMADRAQQAGVSPRSPSAESSMDGSKPAICGHLKTGHFRRPETGVEIYFTASSVGNVFASALV